MQAPWCRIWTHAASLLALAVLLSGCVGISYFGTTTIDEAHPAGEEPFRPVRRPGMDTAEALLVRLGEPDERVQRADLREEWTYDEGLRWNGPVIFVIIPIPLIIPVGYETSTYHLRDGVVENVIRVEQTWRGCACGMFLHSSGCLCFHE